MVQTLDCLFLVIHISCRYVHLCPMAGHATKCQCFNCFPYPHKLQALSDEVLMHSKDVETAKEAGRDLSDCHEDLKPEVQRQTRDMSDRYSQLEAMLTDRSNLLHTALTESQTVQGGLDSLLRWLEDTEATLNRLEERTPISLRKEHLADVMQQYKVRQIFVFKIFLLKILNLANCPRSFSNIFTSPFPSFPKWTNLVWCLVYINSCVS